MSKDYRDERLTEREGQVAALLMVGKTNREVAEAIGINIKTVDTHRGHLLSKLALRNNTELVLWGVRNGWLLGYKYEESND